ncbi:MAG: phosphatase PAP2 family protein [Deltaproteobacteria bacterium]|jgi:acid phosphatase (class A)|nr:phosphatase PAP2 family protein [Deltaproteobacteria bacterium]
MRTIVSIGLALLLAIWQAPAQAAPDGFLDNSETPNAINFLPPPPTEDSPDFFRDVAVYWQNATKKDEDRFRQASVDANFDDNWPTLFEKAFGLAINKKSTPFTYELLNRATADSSTAYDDVKAKYQRKRPFVYFNQPFGTTCQPAEEGSIRNSGSYPSGHVANAWLIALILSEVSPGSQEAVMARGLDYGFSQVICGSHWTSDVEAARYLGSAVYARLHADSEFMNLLAKSKQEIDQARANPEGNQ